MIKLSPEKKSGRINKIFLIVSVVTILIFAGSLLFIMQMLGKMGNESSTNSQRADSLMLESQKILVDIEEQNNKKTTFIFSLQILSDDSCKLENLSFLIVNLDDTLKSMFKMITNKNDLCIRVTAGPKIKSDKVFSILEVIWENDIKTEVSDELVGE